jgi:hypothetical protein
VFLPELVEGVGLVEAHLFVFVAERAVCVLVGGVSGAARSQPGKVHRSLYKVTLVVSTCRRRLRWVAWPPGGGVAVEVVGAFVEGEDADGWL